MNNGTINVNSGTGYYGLVFNGSFSCKGNINCLSNNVQVVPSGSTNDTISGNVTVSAGATFGIGENNIANTIVVNGNISGAGIVNLGGGTLGGGNVFFTPSSIYNITVITY